MDEERDEGIEDRDEERCNAAGVPRFRTLEHWRPTLLDLVRKDLAHAGVDGKRAEKVVELLTARIKLGALQRALSHAEDGPSAWRLVQGCRYAYESRYFRGVFEPAAQKRRAYVETLKREEKTLRRLAAQIPHRSRAEHFAADAESLNQLARRYRAKRGRGFTALGELRIAVAKALPHLPSAQRAAIADDLADELLSQRPSKGQTALHSRVQRHRDSKHR